MPRDVTISGDMIEDLLAKGEEAVSQILDGGGDDMLERIVDVMRTLLKGGATKPVESRRQYAGGGRRLESLEESKRKAFGQKADTSSFLQKVRKPGRK